MIATRLYGDIIKEDLKKEFVTVLIEFNASRTRLISEIWWSVFGFHNIGVLLSA
jgi:predicted GNAT superfamily acetyltransferase